MNTSLYEDVKESFKKNARADSQDSWRTWLTTKAEVFINWGRKHSLWPLPFGTACCAIEFMSLMTSRYDFSRFGAEAMRFSPRQSDLVLVLGTITNKQAAVLRRVYAQMAEPKWVVCVGSCASSGGVYRTYGTLQGIDRVIPVDIYVPGCPPRPEAIIKGVVELQEKMMGETFKTREADLDAFYKSMERQQALEDTGLSSQQALQRMYREAAEAGRSRIW
uniref:NADH-quinone oxidoreductase subunit B n=1 Tax=uncultured bacterium contig00001 TaxID=1181493 RepID=A0A806KF37_9BACT|nr:NADH-ubiquinone oxidoreductase chain B [uncultured bacterium contig00001]